MFSDLELLQRCMPIPSNVTLLLRLLVSSIFFRLVNLLYLDRSNADRGRASHRERKEKGTSIHLLSHKCQQGPGMYRCHAEKGRLVELATYETETD